MFYSSLLVDVQGVCSCTSLKIYPSALFAIASIHWTKQAYIRANTPSTSVTFCKRFSFLLARSQISNGTAKD